MSTWITPNWLGFDDLKPRQSAVGKAKVLAIIAPMTAVLPALLWPEMVVRLPGVQTGMSLTEKHVAG